MLDRMTPEEFDERWAHYLVEPWGDDWEIGGTIAAAVDNAISRYIAAKAGKGRIPDEAIRRPDDYIPRVKWDERPAKERRLTDQESEERLRRLCR